MSRLTVSEQLIHAIQTCGKSQRELSRETGIASSTISRFVVGERTINDQIFSELCEYFDLELQRRNQPSD